METPAADTVRAVMSHQVLAATADTSLESALRLMTEARVHHLPVMAGERCVGLLQESDLLWSLWTDGATGRTVGELCRGPAPAAHPDEPVSTVAARMTGSRADAALVMTNGSIVGIVTAADLVRYLAERSDG